MSRKLAISIEEDSTKAVFATHKRGSIIVEEIISFPVGELHDFLRTEKTRDIYLNVHFSELLQDTFLLPPASDRDTKKLILRELSAHDPAVKQWLFCYFQTAEKIEGNKRYIETLVFAVPKSSVERYITLLLEHGKNIKCIAPNYLPLLNLIPPLSEPALFLYRRGIERAILLCDNEKVFLLRRLPGSAEAIDSTDIQNLNMTVNYAKQRLGIVPSTIYIIGQQDVAGDLDVMPVAPLSTLVNPAIKLTPAVRDLSFNDYIIPVAMLLPSKNAFLSRKASADIKNWRKHFVPVDYRFFAGVKSYLNVATVLMVLFTAILAGLVPFQYSEVNEQRKAIESIKKEVADISIIHNQYLKEFNTWKLYEDKLLKLQQLKKELSPEEFLLEVSMSVNNSIVIEAIRLTRNQENTIEFTIRGSILGTDLMQRQRNFREFTESLLKIKGLSLAGEHFIFNEGRFVLRGNLSTIQRT